MVGLLALVGKFVSEVIAPRILRADHVVLHIQGRGMPFDLSNRDVGGEVIAPGLDQDLYDFPQIPIAHETPRFGWGKVVVIDELGQGLHNIKAVRGDLDLQGETECKDNANQLRSCGRA